MPSRASILGGGFLLTSIMTVIPATIRLSAISPTLMGSISLSLWMTGFLCLLNIALAVIYRKKVKKEVFTLPGQYRSSVFIHDTNYNT